MKARVTGLLLAALAQTTPAIALSAPAPVAPPSLWYGIDLNRRGTTCST